MRNALKTFAASTTLAFLGATAHAGGNEGEHGHPQPPMNPTPTTVMQGQGQQQGQVQGQQQSATGIGIAGADSRSNASAGASAQTGAITDTNANKLTNTNNLSAATGPVTTTVGPNTAISGPSTSSASNGPVTSTNTVAPSQQTITKFNSFVGTNAPNLSGAVNECLVVLGWSTAVNVFGATGVGVGGGNQRAEFNEQCSAVKSAFALWDRAQGDKSMETVALQLLINALPTYGAPAVKAAVDRINAYSEKNGSKEPDSVLAIFGAAALEKKEVAPAPAPVAAVTAPAAAPSVTVVVNPVVEHKETVVKVAPAAPKAPKKKDCTTATAVPLPAPATKPCDCPKM